MSTNNYEKFAKDARAVLETTRGCIVGLRYELECNSANLKESDITQLTYSLEHIINRVLENCEVYL